MVKKLDSRNELPPRSIHEGSSFQNGPFSPLKRTSAWRVRRRWLSAGCTRPILYIYPARMEVSQGGNGSSPGPVRCSIQSNRASGVKNFSNSPCSRSSVSSQWRTRPDIFRHFSSKVYAWRWTWRKSR